MKRKIDGVLLLNKPCGFSSNQVLLKVRWLYQAKKAGHTGTLDPLATGLLPICFGEATKFSSFLLDGNKEYIATIKLGETTTTYDAEGEVTARSVVNLSEAQIIECVNSFLGQITQTPPIYSALKVNGKALYEYARSGQDVVIKTRMVEIIELEILEFIEPSIFKLRVFCSKGSYIRSLAHDIGQKLGCGAHLIGLVRTRSNDFSINDTVSLDELKVKTTVVMDKLLLPIDILVSNLPRLDLTLIQYDKIKYGHEFNCEVTILGGQVRLYYLNKFLGVAKVTDNIVKPVRLIDMCDTIR